MKFLFRHKTPGGPFKTNKQLTNNADQQQRPMEGKLSKNAIGKVLRGFSFWIRITTTFLAQVEEIRTAQKKHNSRRRNT